LGFGEDKDEGEIRTSLLAVQAEVPVVIVTGGPEVSLLLPIYSMRRLLFFISLCIDPSHWRKCRREFVSPASRGVSLPLPI
jgi:hypothetical protein